MEGCSAYRVAYGRIPGGSALYKIAERVGKKTGKPSLCTKTVDPLDIIAAPPIVFSSWHKTQNWGKPPEHQQRIKSCK